MCLWRQGDGKFTHACCKVGSAMCVCVLLCVSVAVGCLCVKQASQKNKTHRESTQKEEDEGGR